MKQKDYPTVLEFTLALENDAKIYRRSINVDEDITKLDIKDCLRWTKRMIKDFEQRIK